MGKDWREIKTYLQELSENNEADLFEEKEAWLTLASLRNISMLREDLESLTLGIQSRISGKGPQRLRFTIGEMKRKYYPNAK